MSNDSPKRRWYQFSLRTLIVSVLVGCVVFAWIGVRMNQARQNRQRAAVVDKAVEKAAAEIEKLGGSVYYNYEERRSATWLEQLFGDPGGPDDPVGVLNVWLVDLLGTDVTDAGLANLKGLTNLRKLELCNSNVTDAGLEHLEGLTKLKSVDLSSTNVTDAGLEHVYRLMNLEALGLSLRTSPTLDWSA